MTTLRKAKVHVSDVFAGLLSETDEGYLFQYGEDYLKSPSSKPVSLTMPLQSEAYMSKTLFPFFDGLIPEGWLLGIVSKNWKIDSKDRFGILLVACADSIGNVSIKEAREV